MSNLPTWLRELQSIQRERHTHQPEPPKAPAREREAPRPGSCRATCPLPRCLGRTCTRKG